ncbi:hypothetical protein VE01_07275 [Pseudogymnoascus verrucosus]|uniref:Uncharacterized protein n=1 Tax=Pseudogymnoascus verrucosus TaxID=342668 RepID=A0A1B8GFC6_9PEZI|nr:uncharacterized protein VE01_07275 [Pseudogymnoascus verrucosus]OBT94539.1 hypothetical protein VE01_07275 [Pseudogymnoascus verrucosus]
MKLLITSRPIVDINIELGDTYMEFKARPKDLGIVIEGRVTELRHFPADLKNNSSTKMMAYAVKKEEELPLASLPLILPAVTPGLLRRTQRECLVANASPRDDSIIRLITESHF